MAILWILLGLIVGVVVTWYFLRMRYRAKMAEQETSWAEKLKKKEAEAAKEQGLHQETKNALIEAESWRTAAEQQTATLKSELAESRESLKKAEAEVSTQRILHEKTKSALAESQSSAAAAQEDASALKIEAADNRQALEKARSETSAIKNMAAVAKSDNEALQAKLAAEVAARSDLEEKLRAQQQAGVAAAAVDMDTAENVRRLESEITTRDQRIKDLEAQLARSNERDSRPTAVAVEPAQQTPLQHAPGVSEGMNELDDLTRIKGIGLVLQNKLQNLGVTSFRQIADFTPADIERVNGVLDFPGRIERERWVEQARDFA